jgi:(S)-ureidoglycine aminohydrolase
VSLRAGGFAYVPAEASFTLDAGAEPARLLMVKRRYEPWPGRDAPALLAGHRDDEPFAGTPVPGFHRRELLPTADPAFDFNMSLLAFDAGVGLDNIEVHDEEHGLYVTAGAGLYFLDGELLEVERDDFIYMAPYCPQGFTATGREPAEYLLYKDVWRDGFYG